MTTSDESQERRNGRPTSIVVVDDHDLFRSGLAELLREHGFDVIGQARTGEEGVRMARDRRPDVLVMDLSLPGMTGIEATAVVRRLEPAPAVLVLTASLSEDDVVEALLEGAAGYLLKDAAIERVCEAIECAIHGEVVVSPQLNRRLVQRLRSERARTTAVGEVQLSGREREILELLVDGLDNAAIAERLFLSPSTVKSHVSMILQKLRVENRVQAAVAAVRLGLV